jgi:hypothetical protein
MRKTTKAAVLVAVGLCAAGSLVSNTHANTLIPYPNRGVENPATYTFTAVADGSVTAYFAGSGAHFSEVLGMTVNGIPTGITGLNDQLSHIGDSLVLNIFPVHAGDKIVFFDQISPQNSGEIWYSDRALNADGGQHAYVTPYDSNSHLLVGAIPSGVYVGFEDLSKDLSKGFGAPNFDYLDETFVVTNVATNVTPLPAALPLFATGLGGLILLGWRRKRKAASIAAG